MKKLFAILTILCMLAMGAAVAESNTWEEIGQPAVEAYGLEGDFVTLNDMGLALWLPSTMVATEPSEEDAAAGRYALFVDEDGECALTVDVINVEGMTLDQALQNATDSGMTEPEITNINGLDVLGYSDPNTNSGVMVLVDTNCNMIIFSFTPIDSEVGQIAFGVISSSLMPAA